MKNDDPTLKNARREAWVLISVWALATAYCCAASYLTGYSRDSRPLGESDVNPIFGVPAWFVWSVIAPWLVCGVFTFVYAGFFMKDDDLGIDNASVLDAEIAEGLD